MDQPTPPSARFVTCNPPQHQKGAWSVLSVTDLQLKEQRTPDCCKRALWCLRRKGWSSRKRRSCCSVWNRLNCHKSMRFYTASRNPGFWGFMNKYRLRGKFACSHRQGHVTYGQRQLLRTRIKPPKTDRGLNLNPQETRSSASQGRCLFTRDIVRTRRQLDAELDDYMSMSRSRLDKELDDYMSMSRRRLDIELDEYMWQVGDGSLQID